MTKSSSSSSFSPDDRTPRRKALPRDNKKTERPPTRRQRAKELGTTPYELKKASVERFEATRMPAIVYEDEQILVISKPGGVAAQAQPGLTVHEDYQTMLDKLVQRTDSPVLKPVHRLDKGTTGCLVFAKTDAKASALSQQFSRREVRKTYIAVLQTRSTAKRKIRKDDPSRDFREGMIKVVDCDLSIDEDRVRVVTPRLLETLEPQERESKVVRSLTIVECLTKSKRYVLVKLTPLTGRKHQLRAICGHCLRAPIVNDYKYKFVQPSHEKGQPIVPSNMILLHAHTLAFYTWDKETGKRRKLEIHARLPSVFVQYARANGLLKPALILTPPRGARDFDVDALAELEANPHVAETDWVPIYPKPDATPANPEDDDLSRYLPPELRAQLKEREQAAQASVEEHEDEDDHESQNEDNHEEQNEDNHEEQNKDVPVQPTP